MMRNSKWETEVAIKLICAHVLQISDSNLSSIYLCGRPGVKYKHSNIASIRTYLACHSQVIVRNSKKINTNTTWFPVVHSIKMVTFLSTLAMSPQQLFHPQLSFSLFSFFFSQYNIVAVTWQSSLTFIFMKFGDQCSVWSLSESNHVVCIPLQHQTTDCTWFRSCNVSRSAIPRFRKSSSVHSALVILHHGEDHKTHKWLCFWKQGYIDFQKLL